MNRRSFIKKATVGIVAIEAGYLAFDTLKNNEGMNSDNNLFIIGKKDAFVKNKMYPFNSGKFYLSVLEDGGFLAISIKCTHLGCIVQANDKGFECPCHASSFDKYGEVLSPPATRALDLFPISLDKEEIVVDIHHPIKRKDFQKSQITYL